jgi:hypothetical protein
MHYIFKCLFKFISVTVTRSSRLQRWMNLNYYCWFVNTDSNVHSSKLQQIWPLFVFAITGRYILNVAHKCEVILFRSASHHWWIPIHTLLTTQFCSHWRGEVTGPDGITFHSLVSKRGRHFSFQNHARANTVQCLECYIPIWREYWTIPLQFLAVYRLSAKKSCFQLRNFYYIPERLGFDFLLCEWFLSIYLILLTEVGPGVYSVSNRIEYQRQK